MQSSAASDTALPRPRATYALATPALDFWLLGGASLVVWAAFFCMDAFRGEVWTFNHYLESMGVTFGTLTLVVNAPHFMSSYALAYGRGPRFVLRMWPQLLLAPLVLVALFGLAYATFDDASAGRALLGSLRSFVLALGLTSQIGTAPTLGRELMGLLLGLMYFTVGWHYSKQTFGCMMVEARFEGYAYSMGQRRLLKASLFATWAAQFTHYSLGMVSGETTGITYFGLGLPPIAYHLSLALYLASIVAVGVFVYGHNYRARGVLPSANHLVPWAAFTVWWVPFFAQSEYYSSAVPFFHSLQYLAFVYKIESTRLGREAPATAHVRGALYALGLVAAGIVFFNLIPNAVDHGLESFPRHGAWFFVVAAAVFINLHHYFIDNAIWRFRDPSVQVDLLAPTATASPPIDEAPEAKRARLGMVIPLIGCIGLTVAISALYRGRHADPGNSAKAAPLPVVTSAPSPPVANGVDSPGVSALMSRALAAETAGENETAATLLHAVLDVAPTHYGARYQLAVTLDRLGRDTEAAATWKEVLAAARAAGDARAVAVATERLGRAGDPVRGAE